MEFKIITGEEFDSSFLPRVMDIDKKVYEGSCVGNLENMIARYEKNPKSFVCVMDTETGRLAGYINFFPCTDDLYYDIVEDCPFMRDDDITPDEIADYQPKGNHLFIISIAIDPDYQDKTDTMKVLSKGFINYLNRINQDYRIEDLTATAVSPDGKKALTNFLFRQLRILEQDHGYIVYICKDKFLEKLLDNELYLKSYHDDIYILLALADHRENHRMDALFQAETARKAADAQAADQREKQQKDYRLRLRKLRQTRKQKQTEKIRADGEALIALEAEILALREEELLLKREAQEYMEQKPDRSSSIPDIPRFLMEQLNDSIQYECDNEVVQELETLYLGEFSFLHTTDDYVCPGTCNFEDEIVIGETKGYVILTAHHSTHMYIMTVLFPDYPYSTSQLEDQMSYMYLKIRDPEHPSRFILLYDYLLQTYGLHRCGQEKCLLCMSNKPKDEKEFENIMSAEVYNSMHINYRIDSREIKECCRTNQAQYDYYEVYLSNDVIAFIPKEFSNDVMDRLEITATYAFIAELVMFQNSSLAKMNIQVSNALANEGEISLENVLDLSKEFGKTARFWEVRNFKYYGTQAETTCITKAFANQDLRNSNADHQQFLEHIVEVKNAQTESFSSMILNIIALILTLIQVQPFIVDVLSGFYQFIGIETQNNASITFNTTFFWGTITVLLIYYILHRKNRRMQQKNLQKH